MNRENERSASDYIVTLSDGQSYCFYPHTFYDPQSCKVLKVRFKVRTVMNLQDEDWKTAIAQNKETIPENTELEVTDVIDNCCGRWLEVIYNNSLYYIDPSKVEYIKMENYIE